MNEEALNDSYRQFVETGYKGSINDYSQLLSSNSEALDDAYALFKSSGYNKTQEDFSQLVGLKKKDYSEQDLSTPAEPLSPSGEELKKELAKRIGLRRPEESEDEFRIRAEKSRDELIKDTKFNQQVMSELGADTSEINVEDIIRDSKRIDDESTGDPIQDEAIQSVENYLFMKDEIMQPSTLNQGAAPTDATSIDQGAIARDMLAPYFKNAEDKMQTARIAFKNNYLKSNPEATEKEISKEWTSKSPEPIHGSLTPVKAPQSKLDVIMDALYEGSSERDFNIEMAKDIALADDSEAKAMLENMFQRQVTQSQDVQFDFKEEPELLSTEGLAKMVGSQISPIARTMTAASVSGPGAILYSAGDAAVVSYGESFVSSYLQARGQGMTEDEAYKIAKTQSKVAATTGAVEGAAAAFTGGLATKVGTKTSTRFGGQLLKPVIQKTAEGATDMGLDAFVSGFGQIVNNATAGAQGIDNGLLDGVPDAMLGEIIFSGAMKVPGSINTVSDYRKYIKSLPSKEQQAMFNSIIDNKNAMESKVILDRTNDYLNIKQSEALANDDQEMSSMLQLNPVEALLKEKTRLETINESITNEASKAEVSKNIESLDMMINSLEAIVVKTDDGSKSLDVIEAREKVNDPKFVKQVAEGEVDISISNNKDLQDMLSKNVEEYKARKEAAEVKKENSEVESSNKKIPAGKKLFNDPNPETIEISKEYKSKNNIDSEDGEPITKLDVDKSKEIADAYENMKHDPENPEVQEAYNAMVTETIDQHKYIAEKGYTFELWKGEGEPYKSSEEMIADVRDNKHMYILPTSKDFGEGEITDQQRAENPLLSESGITDVNGEMMLANDIFRGVHDFFGHSERGNGFGALGEENAWDVHARMYSDKARRAMTTETRGQNSWVNSGKQMRNEDGSIKKKGDEGYMSPLERPFAEQKIGLLPVDISNILKSKKTNQPVDEVSALKEKSKESDLTEAVDDLENWEGNRTFNSSKGTSIVEYKGDPLPNRNLRKAIAEYGKSKDVEKSLEIMRDSDWYESLSESKQKAFEQDFKQGLGVKVDKADRVKTEREFERKTKRAALKDKIKTIKSSMKAGERIGKKDLQELQGEFTTYVNDVVKGLPISENKQEVLRRAIGKVTRGNYKNIVEKVDGIVEKAVEKNRKTTIREIEKIVGSKKTILRKKGKRWVGKVPVPVQDFIKNFNVDDVKNLSAEEVSRIHNEIKSIVEGGKQETAALERAAKSRRKRKEAESFETFYKGDVKEISGKEALEAEFDSNKKAVAIVDGQKVTSKSGLADMLKSYTTKEHRKTILDNVKVYNRKDLNLITDSKAKKGFNAVRDFMNPILNSANLKSNLSFLARGSMQGRKIVEEISEKAGEAELEFNEQSGKIRDTHLKRIAEIFVPKDSDTINKIRSKFGKTAYSAQRLRLEGLSKDNAQKMKEGIGEDIHLSNDRLVNWYNIAKTKDGASKLKSQGVDVEMVNDHINKSENSDLKTYADYLVDEFYPVLKERYEPMYFHLTGQKFDDGVYYPTYKVKPTTDISATESLIDGEGNANSTKPIAGSLNQRVDNNADIDLTRGSFDVSQDYVRTMEWSNQFVPLGERVNEVFNRESIPEIVNKIGQRNYKNLEDHLLTVITGRSPRKGSNFDKKWVNKIMGVKVFASLAGKLASIPKQLTSAGRYTTAEDVSVAEFTKALGGPMNANELNVMMETIKSDYVKDRFQGTGFDLETERLSKEDNLSGINNAFRKISKTGMMPISVGDIGGVLLGGVPYSLAIYRQGIKKGLSHEDAKAHAYKRFKSVSKETQQSSKASEVSHMQRSSLGRLFSMYTTSQKQGVNKMIYSARMLGSKSGLTKTEKQRHAYNIAYYAGENMFFAMVANGFIKTLYNSLSGEDNEDELKKGAYDTAADNVQSLASGFGYNGFLLNMMISKGRGDDWKNELPVYQELDRLSSAGAALMSLALEGKKPEDMTDEDLKVLAKALPIDGFKKSWEDFEKAKKGEKSLDEAIMGWKSDSEKASSKPKDDIFFKAIFGEGYSSGSKGSRRSSRSSRKKPSRSR